MFKLAFPGIPEKGSIMDRLTTPDEPIEGGVRRSAVDVKKVKKQAMTLYWALKKYEDTGLTPKEIVDGKMLIGWDLGRGAAAENRKTSSDFIAG